MYVHHYVLFICRFFASDTAAHTYTVLGGYCENKTFDHPRYIHSLYAQEHTQCRGAFHCCMDKMSYFNELFSMTMFSFCVQSSIMFLTFDL